MLNPSQVEGSLWICQSYETNLVFGVLRWDPRELFWENYEYNTRHLTVLGNVVSLLYSLFNPLLARLWQVVQLGGTVMVSLTH